MKTLARTTIEKNILPQSRHNFELRYASFTGVDGLHEYHIMIQARQAQGSFESQLDQMAAVYTDALKQLGLGSETAVLRRFFCSDPANQQALLEAHPLADIEAPCVISTIGQAPLPNGKVALWAYHVNDPEQRLSKKRSGNTLELQRGQLTHYWSTQLSHGEASDSNSQTRAILADYCDFLKQKQMQLAHHVVRTWLYVRDVDSNYQGLVDARRELFIKHNLTPQTHYIASTGIEGRTADTTVKVSMDAYAIAGLKPEQIRFLQAPQHLGPTYLYGVSFERATAIAYRDRQHIYISGTASIDPAGKVLHIGDVQGQLNRVLENIEALLRDADCSLDAVAQFIVYLRDPNDAESVQRILDERFPTTPTIITWAPVCRPTWLVEIEAIAISEYDDEKLPRF